MSGFSRRDLQVATAAFAGMTVAYPAIMSAVPLLLEPTSHEFGWGRATISMSLLISQPFAAIGFVLVGRLVDAVGARKVLIPGTLLFGLSFALLSQLNGSIAQLIGLQMFCTILGTLPTGIAYGNIISRDFTDKRGLILGLCLGGGGGLGMATMPLISAMLLDWGGWRSAYLGVGVLAILIGLPAALALPRHARAGAGRRADVDDLLDTPPIASSTQHPAPIVGVDAKSALRSRGAVLLLGATFLSCMVINGIAAHMAAIMTDHGLSRGLAALALSTYAAMMMAFQFAIGLLLDRSRSPRIVLPVFVVVLGGVIALQVSTTEVGLFLGAALLGAGAGCEYGIIPYLLTRIFGLRAFGLLYGAIYAVAAVGTGIGPYAMGLAFDLTASYSASLMAFEAFIVIAFALMAFLPPYRFTAGNTSLEPEPGPLRLEPI
jgi:MFS family permease